MRFDRLVRAFSVIALGGALFPCGAAATTNASATFPARYVDAPPPLSLDFAVEPWASAPPIEGFETLTTHTPSKYATIARVLFDAKNIYVAIVCEQPGVPITATQTTNNVGFGLDDFAGIGIDTTGNGQDYFFMTTPQGVRYQQSSESARYMPAWTAMAKTGKGEWRALLVIPLSVLRTQGGVQRWRFNIVRRIAALNDNETWAYDPIMNDGSGGGFPFFGDSRFWPYLSGVKVAAHATRPKPRAEVYGLVGEGPDRNQTLLADQTTFAPLGFRYTGIDVNVPLTGTIAFVGALAPDFSNVEIDQQTIAPQEFRRSFTEYRPFFAQGAQYFQPAIQIGVNSTPNQIFYSPDIGPFNRGEKIEGTYGLQSIGLLNFAGAGFDDSVFGFKHALPDRTFQYSLNVVDAHHQDGNLTLDTDGGNDFTWEATAGGRNLHTGLVYGLDYAAETGSVPDTTPSLAYRTEDFLDVHKQNYETFVGYKNIGPLYNPVDGFTNLADLDGAAAFFDFFGNPPASSPIKRDEVFILGDRYIERDGLAHQSDFNLNGDLVFRDLFHLNANIALSSIRQFDDGLATVGYPFDYKGGVTYPFNSSGFTLGYKDGTTTPLDFSTSWGPFTTYNANDTARPTYLRQYSATTSRPLGKYLTLGLEYDGTLEQYPTANPNAPAHDGQNLRRISLGASLGPDANASISLRDVNGNGGFGTPGLNVAMSYHMRFKNDSELFLNYGTPAASSTLDRVLLKYLVRFGSGAGT